MKPGSRAALIAVYALSLGFALSWILRESAAYIASVTGALAKFAYDAYRDVKAPTGGDA